MSGSEADPNVTTQRWRRPSWLPGLLGIAMMAALLPLRSAWVVGLVLVASALTVPGVLLLRALRVPSDAVSRYPIYVPAASIVVLLFAGLGTDLLGPSLGVSRPLAGDATAFGVLAVTLVLWVIGLTSPTAARLPWSRLSRRVDLLAPFALPALTTAGAELLNNGRGPTVARLGVAAIVATLIVALLAARRLSHVQVASILFACALATELSFSVRSQEVIGYDISTEVHVAQRIHELGIWHASHRHDAYGAMLSLTVLPSTLSAVTGVSILLCFKVIYPLLAALLPVSVFIVADRFLGLRRTPATLAAALILAQNYFFQQLPQLARQEVGLLFFAVLAVAILDDRLDLRRRTAIIAAVVAGLAVSHYSSTYVAIAALAIAFVLELVIAAVGRRPLRHALAVGTAFVLLAGSGALWNGLITRSASNVGSFVTALAHKGLDLNPNHQSNIISTYLSGTTERRVSGAEFQQLAIADYRTRPYVHPLRQAREARYALVSAGVPGTPVTSSAAASAVSDFATLAGQLLLAFAGLGSLLLALRRRGSEIERQIGTLALATVAFLTVIRFSGTVSAQYNQTRALFQSLIIIAVPAAWLAGDAAHRLGPRLRRSAGLVVTAGLGLLLAYNLGGTALLNGGGTSFNVAQSGEDYERLYATPAELAAAGWVSLASHGQLLYADRYGQLRLFQTSGAVALVNVTPATLDRQAWVYATHTNTILGRARGQVGNSISIYVWPSAFLDQYFDTVYSNGSSKVYHR